LTRICPSWAFFVVATVAALAVVLALPPPYPPPAALPDDAGADEDDPPGGPLLLPGDALEVPLLLHAAAKTATAATGAMACNGCDPIGFIEGCPSEDEAEPGVTTSGRKGHL